MIYHCKEPFGKNFKVRTCRNKKSILFCFDETGDKEMFKCTKCNENILSDKNYYHCYKCNKGFHLNCINPQEKEEKKKKK